MARSRFSGPLVLTLSVLFAGCAGESGLDPGSSTFLGNVSAAVTASAAETRSWWARWAFWLPGVPAAAHAQGSDTSLGGILVAIRGDGEATGITDSNGDFRISGAPTGNVFVVLRRGGCEAGFPLDSVPSRSTLRITDIAFDCDTATPGTILESFQAVLRDRPGSPDDLDTCIRAGRDDRRRNVDAAEADFELADGRRADFFDLDADDRLGIDGERLRTGAPGPLIASRVRILERNVNDPCDDDPFE